MSIVTTINAIKGFHASIQSHQADIQSDREGIDAALEQLKQDVLDANTNGAGAVPPGFLIDGQQIVKRNKIVIRVNYDLANDVVLSAVPERGGIDTPVVDLS